MTSNDDIFITDNIKYWGNTDDWENLNMTSRVYVDMDGVIADFMGSCVAKKVLCTKAEYAFKHPQKFV